MEEIHSEILVEIEKREIKKMRTKPLNGHGMAFLTVTGRLPTEQTKGRTTPSKQWEGEWVDADLKDRWLADLNSIPEIEIVSICGGHDIWRPAHIIFCFPGMSDEQQDTLAAALHTYPGTWALRGEIGKRKHMRICMASVFFAGTPIGNIWWLKAAGRIRTAVKRARQVGE